MSERLDRSCRLEVGTRDAIHVPVVAAVCEHINEWPEIHPGDWVKFVDDNFTKFKPCHRDEAHGIINPFITECVCLETVLVILKPGITSQVRHSFEIDTDKPRMEAIRLQFELAQSIAKDSPSCADCYEIRNGEVVRG